MADELYERLLAAKGRKYRLEKAESRRAALLKRKREQERQIVELEVRLEAEQADVEQLTRMSLTHLFYTILRSKNEQLETERQQALAAALRLQEAKQALSGTEAEIVRIGDELASLLDAPCEYERLMAERETMLRKSSSTAAILMEMEAQIADRTIAAQEIEEALTAGKCVLASLEDASASLEKAENWGKWDLWGGGRMYSTHRKHEYVDDAKQHIHDANRLLHDFQDELADVKRGIDISIDISGMLKMADYWFDGLIADWMVQGRINNAQERALEAIHRVRTVVGQLQAEHNAAVSVLAGMKSKRIAWIEGTSPD